MNSNTFVIHIITALTAVVIMIPIMVVDTMAVLTATVALIQRVDTKTFVLNTLRSNLQGPRLRPFFFVLI